MKLSQPLAAGRFVAARASLSLREDSPVAPGDRHRIAHCRGPNELALSAAWRTSMRLAVMPEQLDQIAALATEDKQMTAMRIVLQGPPARARRARRSRACRYVRPQSTHVRRQGRNHPPSPCGLWRTGRDSKSRSPVSGSSCRCRSDNHAPPTNQHASIQPLQPPPVAPALCSSPAIDAASATRTNTGPSGCAAAVPSTPASSGTEGRRNMVAGRNCRHRTTRDPRNNCQASPRDHCRRASAVTTNRSSVLCPDIGIAYGYV